MSTTTLRYRGPEEIEFDEYRRNPEQWRPVIDTHWDRNKEWILDQATMFGCVWIVVCGKSVAAHGTDIADFPDEENLLRIGNAWGLIPFAYDVRE
ncbi:MAG: hypothetical protein WCT44_01395 [Candidatus Paceibacterota bacterium]|jgi:hypothetical protein